MSINTKDLNNKKDPNLSQTDFGYQRIPLSEKTARVSEVFESVAERYDLMNDLMSLGVHRLWKRLAIEACRLRPGYCVLDLAGGTGDLTARMSPLVGDSGTIVLADINAAMLAIGRRRLLDLGIFENIAITQADAQALPFPDNYFDRMIIGFGLRNVTEKSLALSSMYRVLKPGGSAIILEFSKPVIPFLATAYDYYSFHWIPWLGKLVTQDEDSYRYLVESIRKHPDADTLLNMMSAAGFEDCQYNRLNGGVVAIHKGYKY
jgi:demethylmenaquinone methyltransferase/2-methoxy-6-polyprenyl-1,4-benzoquinol methylase